MFSCVAKAARHGATGPPGLSAAGGGWGEPGMGVDGTKPIWGEVALGEGGRSTGWSAGDSVSTGGAGAGAT